jgi:hypothetical protein
MFHESLTTGGLTTELAGGHTLVERDHHLSLGAARCHVASPWVSCFTQGHSSIVKQLILFQGDLRFTFLSFSSIEKGPENWLAYELTDSHAPAQNQHRQRKR